MKIRFVMLAAACLLSGCASQPEVYGNERGGMIYWFGSNEIAIWDAAQEFCAQYKKSAKMAANIRVAPNQPALFYCLPVKDPLAQRGPKR